MTSAEEMASLSTEKKFSLLKRGLPEAQVMAKIWGANVPTVEEELNFVFAASDIQQFEVRNLP